MAGKNQDDMLRKLAAALVEQPRATLQELAQLVGVSKATLYRFCPTREEMLSRIFAHSLEIYGEITTECLNSNGPVLEILGRMVAKNIEEREFTSFASFYWSELHDPADEKLGSWDAWQQQMDQFFLRGQREGVIRLDVPTSAFSDFFFYGLTALIDAERRGRLGRQALQDTAMKLLLSGIAEPARQA